MIVPANSAPPIQGSGGWFWYFPWIWRISKKFVPAEWISIRYLSGVGVGVGTVVTFRSRGPCSMLLVWVGVEVEVGYRYFDIFADLDGTHFGSSENVDWDLVGSF